MALFSLYVQAQNREHILWYNRPAKNWDEALPIGNGRMGAMVYGDYKNETIQLNEESLWGGCKSESDAYAADSISKIQQYLINGKIDEAMQLAENSLRSNPLRIRSYQSLGNVKIDFIGERYFWRKVENYRRELDLETGIASVKYMLDGVTYSREVFASAPDNLIAIRIKVDKPGALNFRLHYQREQDATAFPIDSNSLGFNGQVFDLPREDSGAPGLHMRFSGRIDGECTGGKMCVVNNAFYVEKATEAIFYLTGATDYDFTKLDLDKSINPMDKCDKILNNIASKDFERIKKEHQTEHASIFNRMSFNMGNASAMESPTDVRLRNVQKGETDLSLIALYFQYGRYLLMNSSRKPGVLPANLQGIWNKDMEAAWSSDFHTNINIQMNYWPAEVCNLSDCFMPFSDLINALRVPGRVTAHRTYNSKGWTMNHLTDPFGKTSICDGVGWGTFPMAGPWLVLHQWEHYLFSKNKEYLANKAYPSMKEAAEFVLGFLVRDNKGYLVTAPSNSPENSYRMSNGKTFQLTYGATMDIEIIRELFGACIHATKILGTDKDFAKKLKATMKQLPPIRISKRYGTIQEWIEDYEEVEPGHRHISHLFGLYPGTTITQNDKELFEAARRTIERRRSYNENKKNPNGSYTGWSRAWMINFYARLLDGEEAGENVQLLLAKMTQNNLFNIHPPFQIDGNFGGTAGIAEMLIQSHTDEIRLLPALPSAWKDGEIKGLRVRGCVEVDIKWEDGKCVSASFRSDKATDIKVRYKDVVRNIHIGKDGLYTWKI